MSRLPSRRPLFYFFALIALFGVLSAPWLKREELKVIAKYSPAETLTETELNELGQALAKSIETKDVELLQRLFDDDGFFRRTIGGEELPVSQIESFRSGLIMGVRKHDGLVFEKSLGAKAQYVGSRKFAGAMCPLFRVVEQDGSLDYLAVLPCKSSDGVVRIADFLSMRTGEWLSGILRRASAPSVVAMKRSKLENRLAREGDAQAAREMRSFELSSRLLRNGKPEQALVAFEELSSLKNDRSSKILFVRILAELPDQTEVFEASLKQLASEEPLGTTVPLMRINHAIRLSSLAGKFQLVRDVEAIVGRDPFLDALKAQVELANGNFAEAFILAHGAIELDPQLEPAWWTRVNSALKLRKYDVVAEGLSRLDVEFAHNFHSDDFKDLSVYRPFLRSEHGLEFIRSLP